MLLRSVNDAPQLLELILWCTDNDPAKRPRAAELEVALRKAAGDVGQASAPKQQEAPYTTALMCVPCSPGRSSGACGDRHALLAGLGFIESLS